MNPTNTVEIIRVFFVRSDDLGVQAESTVLVAALAWISRNLKPTKSDDDDKRAAAIYETIRFPLLSRRCLADFALAKVPHSYLIRALQLWLWTPEERRACTYLSCRKRTRLRVKPYQTVQWRANVSALLDAPVIGPEWIVGGFAFVPRLEAHIDPETKVVTAALWVRMKVDCRLHLEVTIGVTYKTRINGTWRDLTSRYGTFKGTIDNQSNRLGSSDPFDMPLTDLMRPGGRFVDQDGNIDLCVQVEIRDEVWWY
jgi:hypothetical protein